MSYSSYGRLIYGVEIPEELVKTKWEEIEKRVNESPLTLQWHGDCHVGDNAVYIVAEAFEADANDVGGLRIKPDNLTVCESWDAELDNVCKDLGIPMDYYAWYLTAQYV
jgi:hypothetical protein